MDHHVKEIITVVAWIETEMEPIRLIATLRLTRSESSCINRASLHIHKRSYCRNNSADLFPGADSEFDVNGAQITLCQLTLPIVTFAILMATMQGQFSALSKFTFCDYTPYWGTHVHLEFIHICALFKLLLWTKLQLDLTALESILEVFKINDRNFISIEWKRFSVYQLVSVPKFKLGLIRKLTLTRNPLTYSSRSYSRVGKL